MPRHIEQPADRHCAPGRGEDLVQALGLGLRALTAIEPGTTSIRTPSATWRPRSTSAAARRSSIRPLVHDPTNTVSTAMSRSGVPGVRPM